MQQLVTTLDAEVRALEALVGVTQRERQHLLAYEPDGLDEVLGEKRRLLRVEDGLRQSREALVLEALRVRGFAGVQGEASLGRLMDTLSGRAKTAIADRRERILALMSALTELNQVTGYHARRQLGWTRAAQRRVSRRALHAGQYGRTGRPDGRLGGGFRLDASV